MPTLDETDLLLDLLREAGDEPVSLDELAVVGMRDPSRALAELERAGHAVHRVYEAAHRGRRIECVRLVPARDARELIRPAAPEPAPATAHAPSHTRGRAAAAASPDGSVWAPVRRPRSVTPTVLAADPLLEAARRFALAAVVGALLVALLRGLRR